MEPNPSIIGRVQEQKKLAALLRSDRAEFVAVYGRRRVGKTFLIKEFCKGQGVFLTISGQKKAALKEQLQNFSQELLVLGNSPYPVATPKSWKEAFLLVHKMAAQVQDKPFIFFVDELPWLAAKKSGVVQALDYVWNNFWKELPQFKLIICGSAASWMIEKIVNSKEGLYQRLTEKIRLMPFLLSEVKDYFASKKFTYTDQQILEIYMTTGGIPQYLSLFKKNLSASQNIDQLCFYSDGFLHDEFAQLFASLFDESQIHGKMLRSLAKRRYGLRKNELVKAVGSSSGGGFNKIIRELEEAGFIEGFIPIGHKKKNLSYRIVDEYSLFYLTWIEPFKQAQKNIKAPHYWSLQHQTSAWLAWAGLSFEAVCFKHINQIIAALGIEGLVKQVGAWRGTNKNETAQIDLIFDRSDDVITLCEIKFTRGKYVLSKNEATLLDRRRELFAAKHKIKKQLQWILISPEGAEDNLWAKEYLSGQVALLNNSGIKSFR